jgi:hypothetical protein
MKVGNKSGVAALLIVGLVGFAQPARARARRRVEARADSPLCGAAYGRALERVQEGRLKEAQELFGICARVACGDVMRRECAARRAQLAGDIPSIVPLVTDNAGEPRILVEVRVDGVLVTSRLDGRAITIDPGKHELAFSNDDGVFATRHLMVVEGERNLPIHVTLHAADAPALRRARELVPASPRRGEPRAAEPASLAEAAPTDGDDTASRDELVASPGARRPSLVLEDGAEAPPRVASGGGGHAPMAWVFGTLGLAGAGGFGLLTYWGRADNNMLASCAPNCAAASVRHVRELYWAADASLGVGVVSLAISTWLFARAGAPAERATSADALSLDVRATGAGGVAAVSGRF